MRNSVRKFLLKCLPVEYGIKIFLKIFRGVFYIWEEMCNDSLRGFGGRPPLRENADQEYGGLIRGRIHGFAPTERQGVGNEKLELRSAYRSNKRKFFSEKIVMATANKGGFVRKKVATLTLGERLLKMREERCASVAEVSRNTGIQIAYLEYLESGEFEKLPAEVYVRGFLRRYAEYLGISDEPILRQYDRERGMDQSMKNTDQDEQDSMNRGAFQKIPSVVVNPTRIAVAIFLVVASSAFLYVYSQYRLFVSEPVLAVVEPMAEVTRTEASSIGVVGKTDPDSRIYINDQPVLVDENGGFREKIDLQKGVNTVTVRSINRFNKEAKKVYSIEANFDEGNRGGTVSDIPTGKKVVIRTEKSPMLVLITVDGEQKVSAVAPAGSRWEFLVKDDMVVSAGEGNGIYATIGEEGREATLSDKAGPISEYRLDREKNVFVP